MRKAALRCQCSPSLMYPHPLPLYLKYLLKKISHYKIQIRIINICLIQLHKIFLHRIMWLFDSSDIILPSVYLTEAWAPNMRKSIIKGRVGEANRVARATRKRPRPYVLTYIRYAYTDTLNFLSQVSQ